MKQRECCTYCISWHFLNLDLLTSDFPEFRKSGPPDIRISGYPIFRISGNPEVRRLLRASSQALIAYCHVLSGCLINQQILIFRIAEDLDVPDFLIIWIPWQTVSGEVLEQLKGAPPIAADPGGFPDFWNLGFFGKCQCQFFGFSDGIWGLGGFDIDWKWLWASIGRILSPFRAMWVHFRSFS